MTTQPISNCCFAGIHTERSEGFGPGNQVTMYFVCDKCNKVCSVKAKPLDLNLVKPSVKICYEEWKEFVGHKSWNAEKIAIDLIRAVGEELIKNDEAVGLPVTQKQEQSNYDKKQRNKLRKEQRQKLEEIINSIQK